MEYQPNMNQAIIVIGELYFKLRLAEDKVNDQALEINTLQTELDTTKAALEAAETRAQKKTTRKRS